MPDQEKKTVPNPGAGGTVSPMQTPDAEIDPDDEVPPVAKADVRANQKLMGEHPEGSAPPLGRLTQDKDDADWSDVT